MANRKHTQAELKALRAKREGDRERYTDYDNPHQVLTFAQWCRLNTFSIATGNRIKRGETEVKPPHFVHLSDKRIGVTVGENRRWQQQCTRKAG